LFDDICFPFLPSLPSLPPHPHHHHHSPPPSSSSFPPPNPQKQQTAYLATLYTLLVLAIVYFLLRYANRSLFRWHTWINISVSYFCAIGILVLIPLDLAVTKLRRQATTPEAYEQVRQSTICS